MYVSMYMYLYIIKLLNIDYSYFITSRESHWKCTQDLHNKRKRATVVLVVLLCFASLHLNSWPSSFASHNFFFLFFLATVFFLSFSFNAAVGFLNCWTSEISWQIISFVLYTSQMAVLSTDSFGEAELETLRAGRNGDKPLPKFLPLNSP